RGGANDGAHLVRRKWIGDDVGGAGGMPGLAMAVVLELRRVDGATIAKERLEFGYERSAAGGTQSGGHVGSSLWASGSRTGSQCGPRASESPEPKAESRLLPPHRVIDAPDARASCGHVEKREAEHRRALAHVQDRERMLRKVRNEIRGGHFAAGEERGGSDEEASHDEEAADRFDHTHGRKHAPHQRP